MIFHYHRKITIQYRRQTRLNENNSSGFWHKVNKALWTRRPVVNGRTGEVEYISLGANLIGILFIFVIPIIALCIIKAVQDRKLEQQFPELDFIKPPQIESRPASAITP